MFNPKLLLLAAVAVSIAGCGGKVVEHLNKEYVLGVSGTDTGVKDEFRRLVKEFNTLAGMDYLRFTEDATVADSQIILTKGLQATDGKVGWGQWITQTQDSNKFSGASMRVNRRIDYAMRLEFDEDFIESRRAAAAGSTGHYELQKLFFHEVGHGLTMVHLPDRSNVMYYEISGSKDFDLYFRDVEHFFSQQ